ncbi:hypothetical protein MYX64_09305 [Nitrospinae bacterium AH_259_B05_G02_I21]|nr:hypothetical protein [Nitrospinae bacterium AH_259_B05_G02_I21]MDA2932659.1 hypothetical protein [Nitrospinae bacterium AH-259-F20]
MSTDLSKKRIIMIHGLASKPPKEDLNDLWKRCIIENIRVNNNRLGKQLSRVGSDVFVNAYWANATPHHIEDDADYVRDLRKQVNKVIRERRRIKNRFHVRAPERIGAFFKDRGTDVVKLLAGALTIKDDVMKGFLRETELYDEDQYIADRMRRPLEEALRDAWSKKCDVALLSHSMGTFISYDVLWRFSHRNVSGFKKFKKKKVRLFATMGSPLGDATVRGLLFARHHRSHGKRRFPTNIDFWHNYACLGDVVSHQHNFEDVFFEPMRKLRIIPRTPEYRAIDYVNLHNPFRVVEHPGNVGREKRNPHKSYGYLVQPRLGTWLADFLQGNLKYR